MPESTPNSTIVVLDSESGVPYAAEEGVVSPEEPQADRKVKVIITAIKIIFFIFPLKS